MYLQVKLNILLTATINRNVYALHGPKNVDNAFFINAKTLKNNIIKLRELLNGPEQMVDWSYWEMNLIICLLISSDT